MVAKKPAKKVARKTTKRTSSPKSRKKTAELKSFRPYSESNFLQFKISRQTVYWTILVAFIIFVQLLILKTQFEVIEATDALNALITL